MKWLTGRGLCAHENSVGRWQTTQMCTVRCSPSAMAVSERSFACQIHTVLQYWRSYSGERAFPCEIRITSAVPHRARVQPTMIRLTDTATVATAHAVGRFLTHTPCTLRLAMRCAFDGVFIYGVRCSGLHCAARHGGLLVQAPPGERRTPVPLLFQAVYRWRILQGRLCPYTRPSLCDVHCV
jgi:hypothetical protein